MGKENLDLRLADLKEREDPTDIVAWFELGGDYDSAGYEADAIIAYNKVFEFGVEHLPKEQRPQLYLQTGSTLRNLERYDDARAVFAEGRQKFPSFHALAAFQALLEMSAGNEREANLLLLNCLCHANDESGSLARYRRSLIGYTEELRGTT